jgi:amidase
VSTPTGLMEAFWAYERALTANDVQALDRLFAAGPTTLRGDAAGLLVGHDAISDFRGSRGGAPQRDVLETHIQGIDDDHALVVAVTAPASGGRGQQTQLWERQSAGWVVTAAHVSVPAPTFDSRIWRVVGDPLVPALISGEQAPLAGRRVAVKDLYAVAGHRVGAGNPTWLANAPLEHVNAAAVHRLLGAGAEITGITRTDEFAYSLTGTNAHYGTPPNPNAPQRIPGGSTSGAATAVSLGQADIGLGTDTGGSIRVPAAYQGLFGIRTTHAAVPTDGLLSLAPSFDAIGWLTRDARLLAEVGAVLLPRTGRRPLTRLVTSPELTALAQADVVAAVEGFLEQHVTEETPFEAGSLPGWLAAFQRLQAWEAWQTHGWWLAERLDSLGEDVRARFLSAARLDPEDAMTAAGEVERAHTQLRAFIGDRVLVVPSTSSVAPRLGPVGPGRGPDVHLAEVRQATMHLTCLAGLAGLPAVSLPLTTAAGLPCGVSLVGPPGRDLDLLELAIAAVEANR